ELTERYHIALNRKTVAKRMRMMSIEGISPRAFVPVTTVQAKRKSTLGLPANRGHVVELPSG
ncbi:hypothetical protein QP920_11480, partial [Corynebacterium marquesiae]|nr:hypothetical protein [Corynebacterium marquesiae]